MTSNEVVVQKKTRKGAGFRSHEVTRKLLAELMTWNSGRLCDSLTIFVSTKVEGPRESGTGSSAGGMASGEGWQAEG